MPGAINGLAVCAGAGGLELGVRSLLGHAYRTIGYVERDAYAASRLVAQMEAGRVDSAPLWDDITTFTGRRWRGCVDLISAGFPCQPWSVAGRQEGRDDPQWIWPAIAKCIREVGPSVVFLENVPGLIAGGGLGDVLGALDTLGFDAEWMQLRADAVGAPHQRERVFLLAVAHAHLSRRTSKRGREILDAVRASSWDNTHRSCRPGAPGLFPPAPGDQSEWQELLAEYPERSPVLKSSLCRMVNGLAGRVDNRSAQLRVLGNGVVPIQAGVALHILATRFGEE